jgi:hypothetical protein
MIQVKFIFIAGSDRHELLKKILKGPESLRSRIFVIPNTRNFSICTTARCALHAAHRKSSSFYICRTWLYT